MSDVAADVGTSDSSQKPPVQPPGAIAKFLSTIRRYKSTSFFFTCDALRNPYDLLL